MRSTLPTMLLGLGMLVFIISARADEAEDKAVKFVRDLDGVVIRDDLQPGTLWTLIGHTLARTAAGE